MCESAGCGAGVGSDGRDLRGGETAAVGRCPCRRFGFVAVALEYADDVPLDRRCAGE